VPRETNTATDASVQTSSIANADSVNTPNTAAIAGGVLGGIAFGIIVTFFVFCWWTRRNQQKRGLVGPDGLPVQQYYSEDHLRLAYPNEAPPYPSKHFGAQPQSRMPVSTDRRHRRHRHSVPSTFYRAPAPLTPLTTTPGQSSVTEGTDMVRAQRGFAYGGKTQYIGSMVSGSTPRSHIAPASPETSEYGGAMLPAYSR